MPKQMHMRVQVVANHKGGVAKTTTAETLAFIAAAHGKRVLLVDMDPQSSLTSLSLRHEAPARSMADVLGGGGLALSEVIVPLGERIDLAPSSDALRHSETHMQTRLNRERLLQRALATVRGRYDLVMVDTPPACNLLSINALSAADEVLIPTRPQALDLAGLQKFRNTIAEVQEAINPDLSISGVLATFFEVRPIAHKDGMQCLRDSGLPILKTIIHKTTRIADASAACQPITVFDPQHAMAVRYTQLAQEIGIC